MNSDKFLKNKLKGVFDEHLLRRELYNPNDFDLIVTRDKEKDLYVNAAGITLGLERMLLKAKDWVVINHAFYFVTVAKKGGPELFELVVNFGDMIGKGNRLPSLPIYDARHVQKF